MMLEFLGWDREASVLRKGVKAALFKNYLTSDLGGSNTTTEVGSWVAEFASTHTA
jgi:isocitrate/isopropylmalate dehydrogenase